MASRKVNWSGQELIPSNCCWESTAGKNFSAATPERQHIENQINSNAQVWGWGGSLANMEGVNYRL